MALPSDRVGVRPDQVDWDGRVFFKDNYDKIIKELKLSNRNLLDNGWFTVNQRGQSSYNGSASYGLDRWWLQNDTNVVVHNGYITRSGNWQIEQRLDNEIEANISYTLSALIRNYSSDESFGFRLAIGKDSTVLLRHDVPKTEYITSEWKLVTWTFIVNENANKILFGGADGKPYSIDIKAIKLEKGPISTLANDVAPNFAEELLKCQRYFVRFKSITSNHGFVLGHVNNAATIRFPIILPSFMYNNVPNITLTGSLKATVSDLVSAVNCTGLIRVDMCGNVLIVQSSGSFTIGSNYQMILGDSNTYIDISAEL